MENRKFNYYYDGQAIRKSDFEKAVPKNWQDDYDDLEGYSFGYYRAIEIDG